MSDTESGSTNRAEDAKQRIKQACSGIIDKFCSVIPDDAATHLGNAKNEMLMAIRSLIDEEIVRTDKAVDRVKESKKND